MPANFTRYETTRIRPAEEVVDYVSRWGLMSRKRAEKAVEFLADPTWRAYVFCYIGGLRPWEGRGDGALFPLPTYES